MPSREEINQSLPPEAEAQAASTPAGQAPSEAVDGPGGAQPPSGPAKAPAKSALREMLETVLVALLVALVIRSFLVQIYVVDGESMLPTLHHGDRLLVNRLVYRLGEPEAGEIVVLQDPQDPRRQLIKRVIAVAGETVEVRNQVVFVDGKPLAEDYTNPMSVHVADMHPQQVPAGYVFVMGDNRGGSLDSRILGPIPINKIVGKAFFLFWPLDRMNNHGPLDASRTYQ